ncbi:hypothetical protein [Qipengyuania zhejiangensis]|uniref:hypothetical protein n=1 Tax=Qipengyuania zhejiangensis TaxID=3077782 RepID=UPI002D7A0729|nr:hypothetical protein [Qipengyuania sp. Z2]
MKSTKRTLPTAAVCLAMLVAACAQPAEDAPAESEPTPAPTQQATPNGQVPEIFAATAWRTTGDDGARYTTYLDDAGTYRDLRNGDPYQQGTWTFGQNPGEKLLCFTPEDEGGVERCWLPGQMRGKVMTATAADGHRIELEQIDYAPADEGDGASE